jgi:membrane protease YdiL (CAAX protease family)
MFTSIQVECLELRVKLWVALAAVLLLGATYTVLNTIAPEGPLARLLAFAPGLLAIVTLILAGLTTGQCYLRWASLSRQGLMVLTAMFLLLIPILFSGQWLGWDWQAILLYAPAGAIAQELFFRAALLPALLHTFKGRVSLAIALQAALFVTWHWRTFVAAPTIGADLAILVVLFLAGLGWGWQVQRDKTILWAVLQHTFFLMLMSLFWR